MKKLLFIMLCITFLGCGGIRAKVNRSRMSNVKIGMTKAAFREVMKSPLRTESYSLKNDSIEYWYYLTGNCLSARCRTPFKFVNGELVGWGLGYYNEIKAFR